MHLIGHKRTVHYSATDRPEKSDQSQNSGHLAEMARKWPEFQLQTRKNIILVFQANFEAATSAESSDINV